MVKSLRRRLFICPLLLALLVTGCNEGSAGPSGAAATPTLPPFARYENAVAFDVLYPAGWSHQVLQEGLLAFGEPAAFDIQSTTPTSSLVVFRRPGDERFDLQAEFDHYLDSGPYGAGFEAIDGQQVARIDGRESLQVLVEDPGPTSVTRAWIAAVRAANGAVYIFTATAPADQWAVWEPTFAVMLASIKLNE